MHRSALRRLLLLLFVALATPTAVLVWQALSEMKWEALHRHRLLAEELATRIDQAAAKLIAGEERRPFTDFSFLNVVGSGGSANLLQRSSLAAWPPVAPIAGTLGYFQIDAAGRFSTPYLPPDHERAARYGLSAQESEQRLALSLRIHHILRQNRLVAASPVAAQEGRALEPEAAAPTMPKAAAPARSKSERSPEPETALVQSQAAFDRLASAPKRSQQRSVAVPSQGIARLEELKLEQPFADADAPQASSREKLATGAGAAASRVRKERGQLPDPVVDLADEAGDWPSRIPVRSFESELDRYRFSRLEDGHFVLFRNVWRDGQRYIQGILLAQQPFLQGLAGGLFQPSLLALMSDLMVAYQGDLQQLFGSGERYDYLSSREMQGTLLYRTALSAPFDDIDLLFSVRQLPPGAGSGVIIWSAALLFVVLCGGLLMLYRLGLSQIELARQQQEFVSAVSHELKTPLTSIRMYGEMLMKGWVEEQRRERYYRYIFDEGERLSRLIENVLRFARMDRGEQRLELVEYRFGGLLEEIRPKLAAQAEQAGYTLRLSCEEQAQGALLRVDADALTQVLINLVDNALKFSVGCARREVELGCRSLDRDRLRLWVRDYGPGVPRDQRRKIFAMFYRSEDEMTRETRGTGIGLALVERLMRAMHGSVGVVERDPGAEFQLDLQRR
ncbi:MAG: sensor histidine kinase [Gammaproteobacteria bacterium]|nr:sensor histidine kinase [Gammaproteobacteria bacterium]